jgi:hypothetical protein
MAYIEANARQEEKNPAKGESPRFRAAMVDVNGLPICTVMSHTASLKAPALVLVHGLGLSHRYTLVFLTSGAS